MAALFPREEKILGPLYFPEPTPVSMPFTYMPFENARIQCLFCEISLGFPNEAQSLYHHLIAEHKLVVDLKDVASYQGYLDYWRMRFKTVPKEQMCPLVPFNGEMYYLLSPEAVAEDAAIRKGLAEKRLEWVLERHKQEREDPHFKRICLFCKLTEEQTRASYVTHLRYQHNLHLGRPDNLVFVDELIEALDSMICSKVCIYCGLTFKDRDTLKEHMRKKFHKRINPKNAFFDRFFISTYVDGGKDDEDDRDEEEQQGVSNWSEWREEGSDWSDWQEEPRPIVCLFCNVSDPDWNEIVGHLWTGHCFDYLQVKRSYNYYEQVKIVNFIRRERHLGRCYVCEERCNDDTEWVQHVMSEHHSRIPDKKDWDQPEFFFPTYENDPFLCSIEEEDPVDRLASQLNKLTRRITNDQKRELLLLVQNASRKKFKDKLEKNLWWGEAAIKLNNLRGPKKSPGQWIKTYSDLVNNSQRSKRKPEGLSLTPIKYLPTNDDSSDLQTWSMDEAGSQHAKSENEGAHPNPELRSDSEQEENDEVPFDLYSHEYQGNSFTPESLRVSERQATALENQARAAERQAAALERQAAAAELQAAASARQADHLRDIAEMLREWRRDLNES